MDESKIWYIFLKSLRDKLSKYEIQQDTSLYNVANIEDWGNSGKSQGLKINENNYHTFFNKLARYNITEYDSIKNIEITRVQLEELNQILNFTLNKQVTVTCPDAGKRLIKGKFIKLSDYFNSNGKLNDPCNDGEPLNSINIFALDSVFIDEDLDYVGGELNVSIIAPKWEIIGNRVIKLDGSNGKSHDPIKAKDSYINGVDGENGKPGLPGGPAGNFIGIGSQFTNSRNLTISAIGGFGGPGQHGGNGLDGINGIYADMSSEIDYCNVRWCRYGKLITLSNKVMFHKFKCKKIFFKNEKINKKEKISCRYIVFGKEGTGVTGNGGNGGKGGYGGSAGIIHLFELNDQSNIMKLNNPGKNGDNGLGGIRGKGGIQGDDVEYYQEYTTTEYSQSPSHWILMDRIVHKESDIGSSKLDGSDGTNTEGMEKQKSMNFIDQIGIIDEYKSYLRENCKDNNDKSFLLLFYDEMDRNKDINKMYHTLELIDELQSMENQFHRLKNVVDFLPFYQSILNRIGEYAKHSENVRNSLEHKKILSYAYTATLGRIYNLKDHSESNLIINTAERLDSVKDSFENLKNIQKDRDAFVRFMNKMKLIDDRRDNFKNSIDKKIEEAVKLINNEITPGIDAVGDDINSKIDSLVQEVLEMERDAEQRKEELIVTKKKLEDQLMAKGIFSFFKILGQVVSFFGPVGGAIGTGISATSSLTESLVLNGGLDIPALQKLPESIEKIGNQFKDERDKKVTRLNKSLKELKKIDDFTTNISIYEQKLQKMDNLVEIQKLENEFPMELQRMEEELKNKKDVIDEKTAKKLVKLKRCQRFFEIASEVADTVNRYNNERKKIDTVDDAINKNESNLKKLKQYEDRIYEVIMPTIQNMNDDLKRVSEKLNNKSRVALDVTKWKIHSALGDINHQMQEVTKGFKVQDNLARGIEKLKDGMDILIEVYDHIENYQERKELVDFITDVSSVVASDIKITDAQLMNKTYNLESIMSSNLVLQQYQTILDSFKQFIFPFADLYFKTITLPSYLEFGNDIDALISEAAKQIDNLISKLVIYRQSVADKDGCIGSGPFTSQFKSTQPFFVWKNHEHKNMILKLLSGQEVFVNSDIKKSSVLQDSIKFKVIDLHFNTKNVTSQTILNSLLENFKITLTHMGNSHYRYKDKIYNILSGSQKISFHLENNPQTQEPIHRNGVYDKIKRGDSMLSPYALWKLKLSKVVNGTSFDDFKIFENEIDLELGGIGHYISDDEKGCSDLVVDKYYKAIDKVESFKRIKRGTYMDSKCCRVEEVRENSWVERCKQGCDEDNLDDDVESSFTVATNSATSIASPFDSIRNWLTKCVTTLTSIVSVILPSTFHEKISKDIDDHFCGTLEVSNVDGETFGKDEEAYKLSEIGDILDYEFHDVNKLEDPITKCDKIQVQNQPMLSQRIEKECIHFDQISFFNVSDPAHHMQITLPRLEKKHIQDQFVGHLNGTGLLMLGNVFVRFLNGEKYEQSKYLSPTEERASQIFQMDQDVQQALYEFDVLSERFNGENHNF